MATNNDDIRISSLQLGDVKLKVISIPIEPSYDGLELTAAEQEVAELAMGGMSDADIATQRGTSLRTVANQLRAIYRKVGVVNRSEMTLKLVAGKEPPIP